MSVGKLIEARFLFVFTRLLILHGDIGGVTDRPHTCFQLCHKTNNPSEKRDIKSIGKRRAILYCQNNLTVRIPDGDRLFVRAKHHQTFDQRLTADRRLFTNTGSLRLF